MTEPTPQELAGLLANRDRAAAEFSLIEFVKQAWPVLEPETPFVMGWAIETIAEHLQAVTDGKIRRLLINVPPGCTKSMMVNVFWPAWEWGPRRMASNRYISASYERTLATRDLVRCRDLVLSEWYQERYSIELKADENQKTYYENMNTGWRYSSGVGSSLIGRRGDRIIIDDPHSVKTAESELKREETLRWMTETVPTRLNKQAESAIVVIMQRLHEQDVSGLIIQKLGPEWVHLCLPMRYEAGTKCYTEVQGMQTEPPERVRRVLELGSPIAHYTPDPEGELLYSQDPRTDDGELLVPARFPEQAVAELEATFAAKGGSYAVAAQLQQRPSPRGGGMFQKENARYIDSFDETGITCRGWDLAGSTTRSGKRTAGVKLTRTGDGRIIVADVDVFKAGPREVRSRILQNAVQDGNGVRTSIPQDPGAGGHGTEGRHRRDHARIRRAVFSGDRGQGSAGYAVRRAVGGGQRLHGAGAVERRLHGRADDIPHRRVQ